MNEIIIVFSSEYDDAGLFSTAAGGIWNRFGIKHSRFVVGLSEENNASIYCWTPLPSSWDLMMIWEPPVSEQKSGEQKYRELLDTIKEECGKYVTERRQVRVLYHNSSQEKCREIQNIFVEGLVSNRTNVKEARYSHRRSDTLYQKTAALLAAGRYKKEGKVYRLLLNEFFTAWPKLELPYLSMLTLLVDSSLQAMKKDLPETDLQDSWLRALEGATLHKIEKSLIKELETDGPPQIDGLFRLLKKVEAGGGILVSDLDIAYQDLLKTWSLMGRSI